MGDMYLGDEEDKNDTIGSSQEEYSYDRPTHMFTQSSSSSGSQKQSSFATPLGMP